MGVHGGKDLCSSEKASPLQTVTCRHDKHGISSRGRIRSPDSISPLMKFLACSSLSTMGFFYRVAIKFVLFVFLFLFPRTACLGTRHADERQGSCSRSAEKGPSDHTVSAKRCKSVSVDNIATFEIPPAPLLSRIARRIVSGVFQRSFFIREESLLKIRPWRAEYFL